MGNLSSGAGADKQPDGDDAGGPDESQTDGQTIEVLLGDRGSTDGRAHAAAEQIGQAAALASVKEDEDNEKHARDHEDHGQRDCQRCDNDGAPTGKANE